MEKLKYYYITKNIRQTSFDGHDYVVPVVDGDIHIVRSELSLCGVSILKKKTMSDHSKNPVVSANRPSGKICPKCEKRYKTDSHSAWGKWVESAS